MLIKSKMARLLMVIKLNNQLKIFKALVNYSFSSRMFKIINRIQITNRIQIINNKPLA